MTSITFQLSSKLESIRTMLRCPACGGSLAEANDSLLCNNALCGRQYPIRDGVPILIDDTKSVFCQQDFIIGRATTFKVQSKLKRVLRRIVPAKGVNLVALKNYQNLTSLLKSTTISPKVLVIGSGGIGEGFEYLMNDPCITLVETDVSLGEQVSLICDAHDLPFEDQTFDAVVAQAVLEHVVDPARCANEIFRVLKEEGLVYAETPFMQQVHMGRFDFTRFTHLGHRRLFRQFSEIGSGVACGPGMALAWAYEYFLLSFTSTPPLRAALSLFARFTSWHLKYFDYFLVRKPGAIDAASGFYFIGRKSKEVLSDRELIRSYRGAL